MINERILSDEELLDITGGTAFAATAILSSADATGTLVCYGYEPTPGTNPVRTA
ncbi:hypothetical protein IAI10_12860 [Clostridium sp. 19966]|uniref:hypothetical protein n=1 Tax=Clostridium sp. 19966 TaxID=2768166 RepID=UPI0028E01006|nr:hypothetical protein [Clostridium sp. 19966]MDT8717555.1 hypothetical protein [Clostridium sp. 19966]